MKNSLTFVISSFGEGGLHPEDNKDPFIDSIQNSIHSVYPDSKIIISCNGLDKKERDIINKRISDSRDKCQFLKDSPGSLKLVTHYEAWKHVDTEWVVFLDSDMVLLKPIDEYLHDDIDYIFTWRKKDMNKGGWPWLNAGTMICRNTKNVRDFWEKYYEGMWKHAIEYSQGDQFAFVELLDNFNKSINKGAVLMDYPEDKIIKFRERDINFSAVHCNYLNHCDGGKPLIDETCILHLKGKLGTIISQTEKNERYQNAKREIQNKQGKYELIKSKIKLWAQFAPKDIVEKVMKVYE